nr:alpha-L-fucosidase [Mucilaginibacter sp.]
MKINHAKSWLFLIATTFAISASAQQKTHSWEELRKVYQFPKWDTEARFGIWVHWGAQTEPEYGGGWYARHMYMQNVGKEDWGKTLILIR